MTKHRHISADLPFSFCERCPNVELENNTFYGANGAAEMTIRTCIHQRICAKTVKLMLETIEKGDQLE